MKKLGIAFLGLALLVMAALPYRAKAFTVNSSDLYLVVSGGTVNEMYVDLGSVSTILTSGGSWNFSNTVAGNGWSLIGDTAYLSGIGNVVFASQSPDATTLNNSSTGVSNSGIDSGFSLFASGNTGSGSTITNPAGASNSFANNLTGNLNGGIPLASGSTNTSAVQALLNGFTNKMNIFTGDLAVDNVVAFSNMIATVTSLGSGNFTLTIGSAAVAPLPPSLVMFVSGLIALGLIARRRQTSF